ncbi:hypothetical protein ACH3XW_42045 [Acanthocheilonema viteae]
MHRTVFLSFLLQMLLCAQLSIPANVEQKAARGLFTAPLCCEAPWKFDSDSGQCILDMLAQGVKDEDMPLLCTAVGFELEGKKCIRYVRLSYKYEVPIND